MDGYYIPENGKPIMDPQWDVPGDEGPVTTDQSLWEDHQIKGALIHTGAEDRKKPDQDYDYVFEDSIDFIRNDLMEGNILDAKTQAERFQEAEEMAAKSEYEKLQEVRRRLPVYPYRDEMLQAIEEHQVRNMGRWCEGRSAMTQFARL